MFRTAAKLFSVAALLSVAATGCAVDEPATADVQNVTARDGGQLELFRSRGESRAFYFRLKAANGEKVLRSQGYTGRAGAERGVISVLQNGVNTGNIPAEGGFGPSDELDLGAYELVAAGDNAEAQLYDGDWTFNLKAANGKVIGSSEVYRSKGAALRGIRTVAGLIKSIAAAPKVDDWSNTCGHDLFVDGNDELRFNLVARNGRTIFSGSEAYDDERTAKWGIAAAIDAGARTDRDLFDLRPVSSNEEADPEGQWYFRLQAGNGEVLGVSQTYASKANAEEGLATVRAALEAQSSCGLDLGASVGRASDDGANDDATGDLVCGWEWGSPIFGDTTDNIDEHVVAGSEYLVSSFDDTTELMKQQLLTLNLFRSTWTPEEGEDAIFTRNYTDEENYLFQSLVYQVDGEHTVYDWIKFYSGDTEVGLIFEAGTTNFVAEIGDGDIQVRVCE